MGSWDDEVGHFGELLVHELPNLTPESITRRSQPSTIERAIKPQRSPLPGEIQMPGHVSIAKQGLTIVVLLLAIQLVFVGAIAFLLQDTRGKLARERHVVSVMSGSSRIGNLTQRLGIALAQRVVPESLREMLGNDDDADKYKAALDTEFRNLRKLAVNDADAVSMIDEQERIVAETTRQYKRDADFFQKPHRHVSDDFAASALSTAHDISGRYARFLNRFKSVEETSPLQVAASIANLKRLMILGAVLNLLTGLVLAYVFVKRVSSRVGSLADNMRRYQNGEALVAAAPGTGDEISRLERSFTNMVDVLAQARRNEEALVKGAYDVICTIDQNGNFSEVNDACERQWGYRRDELLGRSFELIVAASDIGIVWKNLERLKNKSGFISFETAIERIDGKQVEASWSCYWSSETKTVFCFIRDVSELNSMEAFLRTREEQVRTLMANLPVGLVVVDENGVVKSANHKIEAMVNCSESEILERSIGSFLEPLAGIADGAEGMPLDFSTMFENQGVQRVSLKKVDGERIAAEVSVSALDDESSADRLVVVEDISARVLLENVKKDFVVLLRENLRHPLENVRVMIDNEREAAQGASASRIERIVSNADRLLRLIDELLTIETLAPGQLVGELVPAQIADVIEQSVQSLTDYASKQGLTIKVNSLDCEILADRDRLIQVAVNLLSNAIKFSQHGSEIVVAAERLDEFVVVSITDSGKGIPVDMQEAIFRPYVQASESDAPKGTGLGLPICKAIVESHAGSIGVTSAENGGSRFWFKIPVLA